MLNFLWKLQKPTFFPLKKRKKYVIIKNIKKTFPLVFRKEDKYVKTYRYREGIPCRR